MTPGEEHLAFYHEIGLTIAQWAHIENSLFLIAAACVNKRNTKGIASGFFSIENFRSKLAFVDALVKTKTSISPRRLAEWQALQIQCAQVQSRETGWPTVASWATRALPEDVGTPSFRKPPPKSQAPQNRLLAHSASETSWRFGTSFSRCFRD